MKRSNLFKIAVPLVAALFLVGSAQAQSDTQALDDHMKQFRSKVIQKRDSALRTLLEMTDEQSKAFWPLQKAYDKELKQLGKDERDLMLDFDAVYDKLTAQTATEISDRFFALQKERLKLQQKYMRQVSEAVSPVIAVQFIQLQRRFESQLQVERMKYSPLAE